MNHSWEAYENGLKLLSEHIPPERPEYKNVHTLQSSLLENISQARSGEDTKKLRTDRKRYVADLNGIVKQVTGGSFFDLCISNNALLKYLICVYKLTQEGLRLFRGTEEIWADQCKNITERFRQRLSLEHIATEVSRSTIDLHHIDSCVTNLVQLIEDFGKHCPPNRKTTESLRDRRIKIHSEIVRCIESMQHVDNSSFEEFICLCWGTTLFSNAEQPFADLPSPEQGQSSLAHDDASENHSPLSKAQVDVAETEKRNLNQEPVKERIEKTYESVSKNISPYTSSSTKKWLLRPLRAFLDQAFQTHSPKPIHKQVEKSSEEIFDLTKLRDAIGRAFSLEELGLLCADIEQARHENGIDESFSLDALTGTTLPGKAQDLIGYFQRRDELIYVVRAVRKRRPNLDI